MTAGTLMGLGARGGASAGTAPLPTRDGWDTTHDRVFLGGAFWANPMEDWCVSEGGAECLSMGGGRSVHSLTHQVTQNGAFTMSVLLTRLETGKTDGGAGFRIGIRSEINEYRSNCFVQKGINAGWQGDQLLLGPKNVPLKDGSALKQVRLTLEGRPEGAQSVLTLTARAVDSDTVLAALSHEFGADAILGNVSIANNFAAGAVAGAKKNSNNGKAKAGAAGAGRYRFQNWSLHGAAFKVSQENSFGPILWSMYSLSDSRTDEGFVMKLSVLTAPLGAKDAKVVSLLVQEGGRWKSLGKAELDPDAWVATFRIPKWNAKQATPYKVVYQEFPKVGMHAITHEWEGIIKANPEGRPLRMAALTCQNDYGFPYAPVAENLLKLDPDLVFFSGDQIYENHGGFGIIREPAERAILNYLRKFYQHGWAFREVMRNAPTLCLPDDHDVFHGNIWGEGGMKMRAGGDTSSDGGYIEPAKMVNVVHKTNVAHHPDAYDPKPVLQDISVYYGDMVYGGVSFAIIADRQWKSGPQHVQTGAGRGDHVEDANFDTSTLDKPGLVLLGERQEEFLKKWAQDWRGHTLKAVLSQTVFANVATHHGGPDGYLKADLDSGGWPQTPRNRAVEIMRPSMALHINGDQHLTTLTQYGVDKQRDSNWSFCTPAISAGYPRWWLPDEIKMPHENRPKHGLPDTGEYVDGLGNKAYVYAVGNPVVGQAPNRYEKAHEKGSGFGFITFDTEKKTYYIESFRFLIDVKDGKAANQFPGWPLTIHQKENRGENVIA